VLSGAEVSVRGARKAFLDVPLSEEEVDWAKVCAGKLTANPKDKATVSIVKRDEHPSQAMIKDPFC
jgi:hypothetical protein